MRDGALRRAAWRELWPATIFALVLALVTVVVGFAAEQPHSSWAMLVLLPAGFYGGLVVGRCSPRSLAFLFARPCLRERLLAARTTVAVASLGAAASMIAIGVVVRTPEIVVIIELTLAFAIVVLAFTCATVGAMSSDREPLGFGVGVLLFCAMPIAMIWTVELFDITAPRVVLTHPFVLLAVVALQIVACARAVRRLWCDALPLRDANAVKHLLLGTASGWLPAQLLFVALGWRSAQPDDAVPLAVLGDDARGLLVAAGSPGGDVDAILAGDEVLFDADSLAGAQPDITAAAMRGDHMAATVVFADESCAVVLVDPRHGARPLATSCGRLSFSKSGDTLAIFRDGKLVLVDTEHARAGAPFEPLQGFIGWRGENAVTRGAGDRITVGDRKLSELAASGGEISPDEQSVAFRLPLASPGRSSLLRDWGPAVVANLGFDGNASFFVLPLQNAHVVGWLDEEHLVVDGLTTRMHALVIVSTRTGTIVREIPASGGLGITHIEGPLDGPWLVGRSGSVVEAIAVDGTVMWQQYVATLQRDSHEVRRWAIVDGEIIGIDRAGNWWHRELPWEAAQ